MFLELFVLLFAKEVRSNIFGLWIMFVCWLVALGPPGKLRCPLPMLKQLRLSTADSKSTRSNQSTWNWLLLLQPSRWVNVPLRRYQERWQEKQLILLAQNSRHLQCGKGPLSQLAPSCMSFDKADRLRPDAPRNVKSKCWQSQVRRVWKNKIPRQHESIPLVGLFVQEHWNAYLTSISGNCILWIN